MDVSLEQIEQLFPPEACAKPDVDFNALQDQFKIEKRKVSKTLRSRLLEQRWLQASFIDFEESYNLAITDNVSKEAVPYAGTSDRKAQIKS